MTEQMIAIIPMLILIIKSPTLWVYFGGFYLSLKLRSKKAKIYSLCGCILLLLTLIGQAIWLAYMPNILDYSSINPNELPNMLNRGTRIASYLSACGFGLIMASIYYLNKSINGKNNT